LPSYVQIGKMDAYGPSWTLLKQRNNMVDSEEMGNCVIIKVGGPLKSSRMKLI